MPETTLTIANKKGLHARATAKFVKIVAAHDATLSVTKMGQNETVNGASILGLMMLGADIGSELHLQAEGPQAEALLQALTQLVVDKFGEGE